jgi:hypothetical protein
VPEASCGDLTNNRKEVHGVEPSQIAFERISSYRNRPGQDWGIPVWEFAKKGG